MNDALSSSGNVTLETRFYGSLAELLPDTVDVDTLILGIKVLLEYYERANVNTTSFISIIPQYISKCTSFEFSHEFRKKYNLEILGLTQEELPDVDYGYKEVSLNVIDISDKDKFDVLAALYNASTPIGAGFYQYNPMPWNREWAKAYFEKYADPGADGGVTFKWIFGRPVRCTFKGDLVYIDGYNRDNEDGLGQKAISTCPNIGKVKKYK